MFFLFLITWVVSIKDLDPDRYHTTVAEHDCVVFFSDFSSRAQVEKIFYKLEDYFKNTHRGLLDFYQVNVDGNHEFVKSLELKKPGFLLYRDSIKYEINQFIFENAKNYLDKLYGFDIITINHTFQFWDQVRDNDVILFHYGESQSVFEEFCDTRFEIYVKCAIIKNPEVLIELKINQSFNSAIYQKWSQKFFYLEKETTIKNIDSFVTIYSRPLVEEMQNEKLQEFFSKNMTLVILFQPEQNVIEFQDFIKKSYQVRELNEKKWIFIVNNIQSETNFDEFFGLDYITETQIYLLTFDQSGLLKYKYDFNLSIQQFYMEFQEKKIPQIIRSEEIIPYEEGKIEQLVATNFESSINKQTNCLILMYSLNNSTLIDVFEPIQQLNVVKIYSIDIFKNEIGNYQPPYVPCVGLKKGEEFVPLKGDLTKENVIEFLDEQLDLEIKKKIFASDEVLSELQDDLDNLNVFRQEDEL